MKKNKHKITFLICSLLIFNFVFSSSNFFDLQQLANLEYETESESELENNNNNKSKLGYVGKEFNIILYLTNFSKLNFSSNSSFSQNFICEVPTSPPNNC